MKCPKCHQENPESKQFCADCGTRLQGHVPEPPQEIRGHVPAPKEPGTRPPDPPQPLFTETLAMVPEELATGSNFGGRYQVIEELGAGGMGRVYKVRDTKINEKIALKLLRPEAGLDRKSLERFSNELKLARKIRHKNVCQMFDLGEDKGTLYITMEYVRGEDLRQLIRKVGRLRTGQAVAVARQVCNGLEEAHKLGIVHRDLKPQNIMLDEDGNARIMDFGIARSLAGKSITGAGVLLGTPEYMSPEQIEGKDVDERSDIYSLGVVLYEMVTGHRPFDGDTPLSIAHKHKYEAPEDPRKIVAEVPDSLALIILKCLEKDRTARFESTRTLDAALAGIEEGLPTTEKTVPKRKSLTTKDITVTFNVRKLVFPAVAAAAVIVLSAILFLKPDKPAPPPLKTRLAVLPFENLGPPEDEYFADGITDEIIARLTGVGRLGVIARTSSMQYKKTDKPLKQVGEELGVEFIVSGTIRWQKAADEPGRVRVTPTLIRAGDSTQLWAGVYDESIAEIFQVQSDISKKLVAALGIALAGPEERSLETRPTANLEAYDYYLRGLDFSLNTAMEKDSRLAIEMLEKAVSLDPAFLQAYAQLARAHANYYWMHFDRSRERVAMAKEAAEKAFKINPESPEAHMAMGFYYYHCKLDYEQALKHFMLALGRQPNNKDVLAGIGYVKRREGKFEETIEYLKSASELDPRNYAVTNDLALSYALLRNSQEAERWYERTLFLNLENPFAYTFKARLFIHQGDLKKARQVFKDASRAIERPDPNLFLYHWILLDIFEGKFQEALDRLVSEPSEAFAWQIYFVPKANLAAQIHGLMNNRPMETSSYEAALKLLEEKIEEDPEDSRYHSALGIALAGLGRKNEAVRAALKATEILPISKEALRGVYRATDLAQVYTMVGEYDAAFDLIEHLLSIPGEMSIPLLKTDPVWTPLRTLPRFQKLADKFQ